MKTSLNVFLRLHEVKRRTRVLRLSLTRWQRFLGIRGKIELALARLGRLRVEADAMGDNDELDRQMILFE